MAIISLVFLLLLALTGVSTLIIDWVTDDKIYDSLVISQDLSQRFVPPSSEHVLGLDEFGRDILLRILWGTRYSLLMSVAAVLAAGILGTVIGAVAGYYGGKVDNVIMRFMDVVLSLPYMLLAIAIVAALGPGLVNVLISIAIGYVPEFARITRASVMTIREREFVEAAKAARRLGIGLNAGHDLSLLNLNYFYKNIPWLDEVSIGHALISDALYLGLERTIQEYKNCLR